MLYMQQTASVGNVERLLPQCLSPSSIWRPFVESYFTYRGPAPSLLLPTGGVDLLFVTSATVPFIPPMMIHGYIAEALAPPPMELSGVGIRFRPGGFAALTGIPQHEVTGGLFDLSQMVSPDLRLRLQRIRSMLLHADVSPMLIERAVEDLASKAATAPSWLSALRSSGNRCRGVEHLARHAGVSIRQLERLSRMYLGVGPKTLFRVLRLRRCLRWKFRGASWADAALEAGYADQAHLSREARSILGISPTAMMRLWRNGEVFRT